MLQKGLSNRPSCAVALLLLAGSLVLNLVRGENILADMKWGANARSWRELSCYAERAAGHMQSFFEETVLGPPRDYGCKRSGREVVEIRRPRAEQPRQKPRVPAI